LPVKLHIPGAPDNGATPVDASEYDFGDYLHIVDLTDGTSELVGSIPIAPRAGGYELPVLSPDHARIAYQSGRAVVVFEVASGRAQTFSLPAAPSTPTPCHRVRSALSWAPDSARLAVNTETALTILDTGSGALRELDQNTGTPGSCGVAWSPDGAWIAFASGWLLSLIRPDGSDIVVEHPQGQYAASYYGGPSEFVWAPDSTRFFFTGLTAISGKGIGSMSFVSGLDLAASGIPIGDTIAWQTAPMMHDVHELPFVQALSASGTRAAYRRSDHDENWNSTDYVETRNIDGTDNQTLVTFKSGGRSVRDALFWSPDDSLIAYPDVPAGTSIYDGSVRIVNSTGGEDLAAALGPDSFALANGRRVVCSVDVVGWMSLTRLLTWTSCEGSI